MPVVRPVGWCREAPRGQNCARAASAGSGTSSCRRWGAAEEIKKTQNEVGVWGTSQYGEPPTPTFPKKITKTSKTTKKSNKNNENPKKILKTNKKSNKKRE
jgi:hypothetical protein